MSSEWSVDERRRRLEQALRPWFLFGAPVVVGGAFWLVYGPAQAGIAFAVSGVTLATAARLGRD
jgi:hypothetical protein